MNEIDRDAFNRAGEALCELIRHRGPKGRVMDWPEQHLFRDNLRYFVERYEEARAQ